MQLQHLSIGKCRSTPYTLNAVLNLLGPKTLVEMRPWSTHSRLSAGIYWHGISFELVLCIVRIVIDNLDQL